MLLLFKKYKRGLIALSLAFFFVISGTISAASEIELTGTLSVLTGGSIICYLVIFWLLHRKKRTNIPSSWVTKEIGLVTCVSGIIFFIGIFESLPISTQFSAVFTLFFIYAFIIGGVLLKNYTLKKKGANPLSTSFLKKLLFWSFALGVGRVILLLEEGSNNDALIITAFFYFPLLLFLTIRWIFMQIKTIITLKNEKAKTELLHLKSQVNPHFFFNMLNNLYGLVEKDSKKAQELILKLSDMMRYGIYEGLKEEVTLEEEIAYLKNYIALHKMRYHKKIEIDFNIETQENYKVMPLLFIILLENAFKHGVENLRTNAYIHAKMYTNKNNIHFEVANNFDPTQLNDDPGIGLKNLKRRLELVYPNKHSLSFTSTNEVYKVLLTIQRL
ncbi:MAG: histidine kinase [Cellulophaga sp.]